jgi:L-ascorbate metabolism protein UlaG (beta-lactamase superfamily)
MRAYFSIFLIISSISFSYSQVHQNELQINFIANEGFLLKTETKQVLIDALFTEGYGYFDVPSADVIKDIMNDKVPYDNVNLYFLTHYHGDHCNSALINEYLTKHKKVLLVTSKPSIDFINGNCFNFILLKKQFCEITPEINQSVSKSIKDIPVKVFGLKHMSYYRDSIDMDENMFNVSFWFNIDGIKVFHSGDIQKNAFQDYLTHNKKWTDSTDVAFLYYGLFESGVSDLDYILSVLHPRYIVIMHLPPSIDKEWSVKVDQLKKSYPNIILFNHLMNSQTIKL